MQHRAALLVLFSSRKAAYAAQRGTSWRHTYTQAADTLLQSHTLIALPTISRRVSLALLCCRLQVAGPEQVEAIRCCGEHQAWYLAVPVQLLDV